MPKPYIDVLEEHDKHGVHWGIILGSPNPESDELYIAMPNEKKAFEVKAKINSYLEFTRKNDAVEEAHKKEYSCGCKPHAKQPDCIYHGKI